MRTTIGGFWDDDAFEFDDPINREIFANSALIQVDEIGIPRDFGAQQSMTPEGILPWVPDPVGRNWKDRDSLLLVGASYAGIFHPYSTRGRTMSAHAYANALSPCSLQRLFLNQIIALDGSALGDRYYGPIEQLCFSLRDASRVTLLDLCRASYVKRTFKDGREVHISNAKIVEESPNIFVRYVEAPTPEDWLWRRIAGGNAIRIVALGTVAEHGLLRLFQRRGMSVYVSGMGPLRFSEADLRDTSGSWVKEYAYARLRLGSKRVEAVLNEKADLTYWIRRGLWWSVRSPDGDERWRLLPAYHPRYQTMERIQATRELIESMVR